MLSTAERAERALAIFSGSRSRTGQLTPLATVLVSGVPRRGFAQRLRGVLADLTGVHVHPIVDVRQFGATTAVVLTAAGAPAFSAAAARGVSARVLTVLDGVDAWSPALLGPRRRSQLSATATTAEAAALCRRGLTAQLAAVPARTGMPPHLRASLEAFYRADLLTHAGEEGMPDPTPPANRPANSGVFGRGAELTATPAAILSGEGDGLTPPTPPTQNSDPPRHVPSSGATAAAPAAPLASVAPSSAVRPPTTGPPADEAASPAAVAANSVGAGGAHPNTASAATRGLGGQPAPPSAAPVVVTAAASAGDAMDITPDGSPTDAAPVASAAARAAPPTGDLGSGATSTSRNSSGGGGSASAAATPGADRHCRGPEAASAATDRVPTGARVVLAVGGELSAGAGTPPPTADVARGAGVAPPTASPATERHGPRPGETSGAP